MSLESSEGFNKDYRFFSEAAKEVGVSDKETRKIIFEDPALFFDEMSPELKSKLTPKALTDLFMVLVGKAKDVNPRSLLTIGNVLYEYRPHVEQKTDSLEVRHIQESDMQKVDLAYVLIENAMYEGRLSSLSKEQLATLAFTINTMGKLFLEGKAKGLKGFDQEKFDQFVSQVEGYEVKDISGECYVEGDYDKSIKDKEVEIEKQKEKSKAELQDALPLVVTENLRISKDLDEARRIIEEVRVQGLSSYCQDLKLLSDIICIPPDRDNRNITTYLSEEITVAIDHLDKNNTKGLLYVTAKESALDVIRACYATVLSSVDTKYKVSSGVDSVRYLIKKLKEIIPKERPKKKRPQMLSSFGELADVVAKDNLPKALEILERLDSDTGLIPDIMKTIKRSWRLIDQSKDTGELDSCFKRSTAIIKGGKGTSAIAYTLKSILIASDMIQGDKTVASCNSTARLDIHGLDFNDDYFTPRVHSFLKTYEDSFLNPGPAYANLHYIPVQIPFSVFAWRYMRSQETREENK